MRESILRDYFLGVVDTPSLQVDLLGSVDTNDLRLSTQYIADAVGNFELRPEHLVKLCDDVLAGNLLPNYLETVGFALIASDY